MERSRSKFRGLLLVPNLSLHTNIYLWTKLGLNFLKCKSISLDDIFFIWTHGKETLSLFLEDLNNFHPNIKFSYDVNKESIHFLYQSIRLSDGNILTDFCVKPTDMHQFLHYTSSHPDHTKCSTVFSQALRVSRICSGKSNILKKYGFQSGSTLSILLNLR